MESDLFNDFIGKQIYVDYKAADRVLYIQGILGKIIESKLIILHRDGKVKGFIDCSSVVNIRAEVLKEDESNE